MQFSRRGCLTLAYSWSLLALLPKRAEATTLRALSLAELVESSARVSVGVPVHHESDWAYVGGSRRIVTWTRFAEETDFISGAASSDELLLVTLGGKVGNLRQKVPGEAALTLGKKALLFSGTEAADGTRPIVGMAQGEYPIEEQGKKTLLRPSRSLPHLVKARPKGGGVALPSAVELLSGKDLEEARSLVRGAK